ncbi:ABC transporter permease [Phytomonospora endophytica]|uniref:Peptide/nickel transport system permease protein n=1 Tax=Phytomonospora endophytica TaxID=714109 RepID=A0A841FJC0_9ACTN|nr:ABC transporter permease [Phytomonospora endophytica]MBB6033247.1 peptide/nickel transport system permease protein [Phytomonospora endophytica]GIG65473.1 ABC transporter permease [Phytomonospora endophytica]
MLRFVVRRLLLIVLTLTVVSFGTFMLFFAAPSDPARILCGTRCQPAQIEAVRDGLGLDRPIMTQYVEYMGGIFAGRTLGEGDWAKDCSAPCFGYSYTQNQEVSEIVARALPVSASVAIGAWIIQTLISVSSGVIAARKRGTAVDRGTIAATLIGGALPIYFVGPMLLLIFRYQLEILPQPSYTPLLDDPLAFAGGMIMPWATLAIVGFAFDARLSRSQMLETLDEDFIRTSRAKGLKDRVVFWRHALRASATPLATSAGLGLGGLLGGAVVTESIFGLNGLGKLSLDAITARNLPIVMATVLIAATFVVFGTFIVDMLYAAIDPRVRLS